MNDEVNFCSQCGAKVSSGAKFCSTCGHDLQNSSTKTTSTTSDKTIKTENMGRLLNESPTYIIANSDGIPIRLTSTLDDLFIAITRLK